MEKRNAIEEKRTPCRKGTTFCDCEDCKTKGTKQAAEKQINIQDIEALAKVHK